MVKDTRRISIPKADQLHIFNRDNWTCKYCGDPVFFAPTLKLLEEKSPGHGYYQGHGKAGKMLSSLKAKNIGFAVTSHLKITSETDVGQVLVEGLTLGSYKFNQYKESHDEKSKLESIKIQCCDPENITSRNALKTGIMRADGTNLARNLGNTPANDLKPKDLASAAENIAKQHKIDCTVLEEKQMKKLGMEMLLGVSRGSREPAKLILMEYFHQKAKQTVALVGSNI